MSIKATLRVVLLANEITVAESADAELWQNTLSKITGRREGATDGAEFPCEEKKPKEHQSPTMTIAVEPAVSVGFCDFGTFSDELQLDPLTVQGACDPSIEPPFIHLDVRAWQEFRRNTPLRGNTSIPPIVLAATLLVLWFRSKQLGTVTISQAQAVLNTIDTRDKNPARGLRNCDWLQTRDDTIKLNPSRFDEAIEVARAYCSRQPLEKP